MNLEQAKALKPGQIIHWTGDGDCQLIKKPRGGLVSKSIRVKVNGAVQTWKRDQNKVKVPIKHGMYAHGYLTEDNLELFHLEDECPLIAEIEKIEDERASQTAVDNLLVQSLQGRAK